MARRPHRGETFKSLVDRALAGLPERFKPYLENVTVEVEEFPTDEVLADLELPPEEAPYGYYQGTPLTERSVQDGARWPDRILIYRRPLMEDFGDDPDALVEEIRITVLHEIGHHFGLDEEDMAFLEPDDEGPD